MLEIIVHLDGGESHMNLKSNLFLSNDYDKNAGFQRDFKIFSSLSEQDISKLLEIMSSEVSTFPTEISTEQAITESARQFTAKMSDIKISLQITMMFIGEFQQGGDAVNDKNEDIIEDLITTGLVRKEQSKKFLVYLEKFRELSRILEPKVIIEKHKRLVLPNVKDISITLDYRVAFDSYPKKMDIEKYNPKFLGVIPIALIRLKFDDTSFKDIYFQADKQGINKILDSLKSIEKLIEISSNKLQLGDNKYD